jgi:gliding motility-associated lipoprotein GldH
MLFKQSHTFLTISKSMFLLLVSLFLFSCDSNKMYEQYIEVENGVWKKENLAKFTVEVVDTINAHNLYINVRNKGNYQFSNLYLFVTIQGPDGGSSTDTVNCVLADKRGKWLGKGIGDLWDLRLPYIGGFKFAQSGKYIFTYEQAMRVENGVEGITDLGLRIERKDN